MSTDSTAGGTTYACAYRRARRAAKLLTYDVAKCTTNAASKAGCAISGSHRSLRNEDAQKQDGQCHFHFVNLYGLSAGAHGLKHACHWD
ncbi:hypothetical protein AOA59_28105 [Pseudomonas sp. 2822-15]|nr:hypothetical protein AOA59_28105 [Pseudomonas sp. 2822-15]